MQALTRNEINKVNGHHDTCNKSPSVIIIGAGAAGIAAATRLVQNDIRDILILEAEDRAGGRIDTRSFQNSTVDLGAQFCHGTRGNVVYEMVKDLSLLESELGKTYYTMYHSSRKEIDRKLYNELIDLFQSACFEKKKASKATLGEYMLKRSHELVLEKYGDAPEVLTAAKEALNTYRIEVVGFQGTFSWFDIAADSNQEEHEGDQVLGWKGRGYQTILDIMLQRYPDPKQELPVLDKILLNKKVTTIKWGKKQVVVDCGKERYAADHVIFTPSLGVLKYCHATMFNPMLPGDKIRAIDTIGMGSIVKVIYYFPSVWWPKDFHDFSFVWSQEHREKLVEEFPASETKNGTSWLLDVLHLIYIANSPNLLGAWICGESVPEVELLPDEQIIDGTMFLIDKFLGHLYPEICKPTKILKTNWNANGNFLGCYSYQTLESRAIPGLSQEAVLAEPLASDDGVARLLFAGEATSPTHYATVHGAIETGWREADRIIAAKKLEKIKYN